MKNCNLVSSKQILAKVIADYNLAEDDIRISDIKSWIGEGMELIGAVNQLDHRVATVQIKDYQCKLPCDMHQLDSVAYSTNTEGWIPVKKTTGTFSVFDSMCDCDKPELLIQDTALIPLVKNMFNLVDDKEALDKINEDPNIRKTLQGLINNATTGAVNGVLQPGVKTNTCQRVQYDIKPGYLVFNLRNGNAKISYRAIHLDNDGMPMIPDNQTYKEALIYFIGTKLLYPDYIKGNVSQHVYYNVKNSWNFYRKSAYAEAMLPYQDELNNIQNTWHTLVPEMDANETFFSHTGDREQIYNQSKLWS